MKIRRTSSIYFAVACLTLALSGLTGGVPTAAFAHGSAGDAGAVSQTQPSILPPRNDQNAGAPAAETSGGVVVLPSSYLLAPDDILDISVLGQDETQPPVTVLPDGTINYSGAGTVVAAGKTVTQLEAELEHDLLGQYRRPIVTVSVRETHSRQISVLGGVQTEGLVTYKPGMRLLNAIASSGGLKQAPELSQTTLITDHGTKTIPIDMTRLMVDNDMALNLPLSPGDLVLVSPRDPEIAQVQVMGQVEKPGAYPVMPQGATILDVLNLAGGETKLAEMTRVQIMHDGRARTVNLRPLLFNIDDPVGATRVVAGDVVNVPLNDNHITVVGEVRNPLIYTIPDGEKWTVLTALTSAGGPTPDGDKKRVALLRPEPDGQYATTTVNTENLLRGKPDATDPIVQPGDILVVPKRHEPLNVFGALQAGLGAALGLTAISNVVR